MKARIGKSTYDALPEAVREAAKLCAQNIAEERWREVQKDVNDRFVLILALALNDVYGFGAARIGRVIDAMGEIAVGYSEESYKPSENRVGTTDMKRMGEKMAEELKARGIDIKI